jgi:hypothetical protein
MKVFLWKDVTQKIFKPRSTLKRTRPVSDTTLELKQSVQKRDEKHEHGHPEYEHDDHETFTSEDADLAEESISDDDQEKHREALRKHPRLMKRLINKGYVKVKKAFFIDKKV